jgi:hypothetical protein
MEMSVLQSAVVQSVNDEVLVDADDDEFDDSGTMFLDDLSNDAEVENEQNVPLAQSHHTTNDVN